MSLYRKNFGKTGEDLAVNFLKNKGFTILQRNFFSKFGEIDIIATKNNKLHFVEVKTRSNLLKGLPHESITFYKIRHLKKACMFFLLKNKIRNVKLSLDVVSILLDNTSQVEKIKYFEAIDL